MISLDSLASSLQVRGGDLLTPLMYILELQAVTMVPGIYMSSGNLVLTHTFEAITLSTEPSF